MKFDALVMALHDQAWFDLPMVALFFPEEDMASLRTSLYRFMKNGKLFGLRRGLYTFSHRYRQRELHGPLVANICYRPSYLSERWALSWYGIIPEKTVLFTSVSPKPTRNFRNQWGEFRYRTIKDSFRSGYVQLRIQGVDVMIAEPEQALLDLWYLEGGEWTEVRMESLRFDPEDIDDERLAALVGEFPCGRIGDRERLDRAANAWILYRKTCSLLAAER